MSTTIRAKIDGELTRRVGKWFTVREIQDKLSVNPATLKPLIMKYAREHLLRRRRIKGTARGVEFSPSANSIGVFQKALTNHMPYRNFSAKSKSSKTGVAKKTTSSKKSSRKTSKRR